MQTSEGRRRFLAALAATGASGFIGPTNSRAQGERLETTSVRLAKITGTCIAPQYLAEELLRLEGFTDVRYILSEAGLGQSKAIARGDVDFSLNFAAPLVIPIDAGEPITIIGGVHTGCFELFGREQIRSIADLKGKTVGVQGLGASPHVFLAAMAAHVGLDPVKDINWVTSPKIAPKKLFAEGKADAFLGFPPEPQELRARKIGRVIVNTATDKPWSQYYCCMLITHRAFLQKYPVATKRAARAMLKAADLCAQAPERAARTLVDKGFAQNYNYALETLKEVRYDAWRIYNPEDTMRFHALRLHELGMIKSTPQSLIARGSEWRFLNDLKKELKA